MRNRRLALAAALLLAITSADGAALAVSGADFSSEEVAEAVFDTSPNNTAIYYIIIIHAYCTVSIIFPT